MKIKHIIILLILILVVSCSKGKKVKLSKTFVEFTTDVTIIAYGFYESDRDEVNSKFNKAQNIMEYFNNEMSPELETSTLSKMNKEAFNSRLEVPLSLRRIFKISHNLYKYTDKSFDIALSPVIKMWGFNSMSEPKLPNPIKLIDLLKISNFDAIEYKNDSILYSDHRCGVDLGGIGKGYAVDSISTFLIENGINDFIVEAGGDLLVKSETAKAIGIRHPRIPGALIDSLYVKNGAVATSGDYEKYFIQDDTRYCHIIDPETGYGVSDLVSVTVISEKAYLSDAFSTAVFVMGKEDGKNFLLQNKLSGLLVYEDEKKELKKIGINLDRYKKH